ncbi:putative ribonuclease H-like domain-containing protein [Tanacetum coccineum]
MDLETAQTTTTAKFLILKQGEYDMWRLRIEQYFQVQDYTLWDVIENGNSFKPAAQTTTNADGTSTSLIPCPYKDAKTLFAAIQTRFGGNEATKKTQKTLLKLQKIVSQLAILGENISQEDLNLKFLRSLPSEWNTHVLVKGTASSSSQNMAFVSSPRSTNEVNTAYGVSTANTQVSPASTQVSTAGTQVNTANLSDDTVYAFLASQPNESQLVYEDLEQIHEDDIEEMDLKWQLALLSMRTRSSKRTINVEETSFKSMVAIDGAGFDWSYMADDEVPTNMALMHFSDSEFNKSEFNLATYKRGLASVEEKLVFYKKKELEKLKHEKESNQLKIENFDNASKSLVKLIGSQIPNKSRKGMGFVSYNDVPSPSTGLFSPPNFDLSNSGLKEFQQPEFEGYGPKTRSDFVMYNKTCFVCGSFDHVPADCNCHQRERVVSGNNYKRVNYNYSAKKAHPSTHRNMVPRAVLMQTSLISLNTARPINTVHPKTTVYSARPRSRFSKSAQSTVKRPYQTRTTLTNKNFSQKVNTAKGKFYTARPKAINTARPNSTVINDVRANQGHPQKEDHGYVDSECSKHMTGNITLKTGKLDFEDVYFVKEFQFNLFSVSHMCDKKNSVLFTDTGCFILSPGFKLADESQVLLKVPRKNNMYSVDMKNIVPKESLTCLVAKAKLDESMLWHRKLGHVNFKTINKIVKENLVGDLPLKRFENDQTCVACLKGKQHKASCKSNIQNSITQPLFMLHMDLFGPTFVSSLMNKKYCLVVTNDYSRFTWVFFLATKDETYGILKSFITEIENPVDKKVKIIRCDNGTKFKNRGMSEFCEKKGIKKEFSNRVLVVKPHNKTPFELFKGDGPKWLFDIDVLTKSMNFVPVVTGTNSYDLVDGSLFDSSLKNVSNDEPQPPSDAEKNDDEGVNKESGIDDQEKPKNSTQDVNSAGPSINTATTNINTDMSNITTTYLVPSTPNTRIHKDHSLDPVIGDVHSGVQTRRMTKTTNEQGFISAVYEGKTHEDLHTCLFACFLSQEEPKKVWTLVDLPHGKRAIGTKWVYKNKKDERGIMIRNKARLVVQGYTQENGIDYDEVFALVARIKAIRLFIAYASFKDSIVYQMDVKSAFLYGKIEAEVYVCQPPGFEDPEFPDRVYKVEKALYGIHQAPRAWYETLSTYLLDNGFQRGQIDKTLFIKRVKSDILLV